MYDYTQAKMNDDAIRAISSIGLAHLGDAVYELLVRTYLCVHGMNSRFLASITAPRAIRATEVQPNSVITRMIFQMELLVLNIWSTTMAPQLGQHLLQREEDIGQSAQHGVDPSSEEAGDCADQRSEQHHQQCGEHADAQRGAGAVDHTGVYVATLQVEAERMA